ncbi:MAG: cytochrome c biogenesis protein CcdA [Bacteroidales bacterium]|nr:cytochrome c biogenesis protein CcdA [Bacteroidales bacterium]HPS51286.1 cytochrome c biogenesis protein CcdA [Bacteroidales bacterium]
METWINHILNNGQASPVVLFAVLLLGMLSVFTCACNVAILGVVAGYSGADAVSGKSKLVFWKSTAFLIGTVLSMSLIGALFGFAGKWISDSLGNYWKIAAGLIAIVFGLYSMDLAPFRLPEIKFSGGGSRPGVLPAIVMGLTVGGLSAACNTCCNPFFPVILAASFVKGSALWGFLMLLFFALGFAIPLAAIILGIGMGLGKISGALTATVRIIKYIGGIALVLLGFYLLLSL